MTDQLTILVTGATAGFGEAIAQRFCQRRAQGYRHRTASGPVAPPQGRFGRSGAHAGLSMSPTGRRFLPRSSRCRRTSLQWTCWSTTQALPLGLDAADAADLDDWDTMVDTNIKGLTYCTRAVLPGMVERGRGHVINIGSVAASYPYPGGNAYGATKAFVRQFSLNLRSDMLGKNVARDLRRTWPGGNRIFAGPLSGR